MSLCPEHNKREAMTDDEFWQFVFGRTPEEEESWADYWWSMEGPDVWVIDCARCGRRVDVPEGQRHTRERDAFCDDCAENHYDLEAEIDKEHQYHRQGRSEEIAEGIAGRPGEFR